MSRTSKKRIRNVFSLEMSTLFALLSAASRVKRRPAVLSRTHRLTLPYALGYRVMSILGKYFLADGRMEDGGWFRSPPWPSGGASDRSFAEKAQALAPALLRCRRIDFAIPEYLGG